MQWMTDPISVNLHDLKPNTKTATFKSHKYILGMKNLQLNQELFSDRMWHLASF